MNERTKIADSGKASWSLSATMIMVAAFGALAFSVIVNVLLANRVHTIDRTAEVRLAESRLQTSETVKPIVAKRLGGEQELISYGGAKLPTVLYIFRPSCPWCARNMDNLKVLQSQTRERYRFIGISLSEDQLQDYVRRNDLRFPVYSDLSPEVRKAYKLRSTPQTIVVSSEGKVLQDWIGAYAGEQKTKVETFFRVHLPGVQQVSEETAPKSDSHISDDHRLVP